MKNRPSLFPIFLVNFIGALGFSIVLPFLVAVVTRLGGGALAYGLASATYSAFQLLGAPLLGKWSDRHGRRKILLLSQIGTLLSWILFLAALYLPMRILFQSVNGLVLTLPLLTLFLARALDGLTGGNVSVANAYLADLTRDVEREKQFGRMAVATNLGFVIGPILAGLLGDTHLAETLPVLAAIAISLVASLVIGFYLPESSPCTLSRNPEQANVRKVFGQEHRDCFEVESGQGLSLRALLGVAHLPFLLVLNFLIFLGFNVFYVAFPVYTTSQLSWSTTQLGFFFSFLGLTTILVQGPLLGRVSKVCRPSSLVVAGGVFLAIAFLLLSARSAGLLYLGGAFFSLGNGLQWPSFMGILSRLAGPRYQGAVHGLGGSIGSLASIAGLVLGGLLYQRLSSGTFLVAAGVFVLVTILSLRLGRIAETRG